MGRQNDMGKDKDYITVNITIEQAVKAIVRSFGETQDTVIISMANHRHGAGFRMSYKEWEITIPDQESVHIECYIPYNNVIGYLFVVAEKGWDGTYIDQTKNPIILITKTKDGDEVIYQGTKYESKIARINEVREKYTGEPIPFRKFKANITVFEKLLNENDKPIPSYWVDGSEEAQDTINNTGSKTKRKNVYMPRNALTRLMLGLAKGFAKQSMGGTISGAEMLILLGKNGATVGSSNEQYIKLTDEIKRKVITVSKNSFEKSFTRIRKHLKENYPT